MNALAWTAATIAALTVMSALFSASETALTSVSRVALKRLKNGREGRNRRLVRVLSDRSRVITTLLIGNNLVNIWASSVATAFAIDRFGDEGVAIATAFMTVLLLVFAEIGPKGIASRFPVAIARSLAPFVTFFTALFKLPTLVFTGINSAFLSLLNRLAPDATHRLTEEEIRAMVDLGQRDGALEAREHRLMQRAFDFGSRRVREIMTPRTSIAGLPAESGIPAIREAFRASGFSRMPIFSGDLDTVSGILHFNDLASTLAPGRGTRGSDAKSLSRPALFVPETQTIPALLAQLDRERQHMAIVVDERGNTAGLVTIDDAIASIFGALGDRARSAEPARHVQVLAPDHLKIPGNLRLDDFNALLKTNLDSEYYETVGGYLLERIGRLPAPGERCRVGEVCLTAEEIDDRAIRRIDVTLGKAVF